MLYLLELRLSLSVNLPEALTSLFPNVHTISRGADSINPTMAPNETSLTAYRGPKEDGEQNYSTDNTSKSISNDAQISNSNTILPFLSFPPELGAKILHLVAQEQDAYILPNGPEHPLAFHSLEAVRAVRSARTS